MSVCILIACFIPYRVPRDGFVTGSIKKNFITVFQANESMLY